MRLSPWVLSVAVVAALACGGTPKIEDIPPGPALLLPTDIAVVAVEPIATGPRVSGTLEAADKAVLRAEAQGTVSALYVEVGDRVSEGQDLARIENNGVQGSYASARAAVASAEVDVANADRELERVRRLAEGGAVAPRDLEQAQYAAAAAQARFAQAKASLAAAGEQIEGVNVTAPISGVVSARAMNRGDVVAPGGALLTIIDPSTLRLEAAVPAASAAAATPGARVVFTVQGQSAPIEGTIDHVAPAVDPATRQVAVLVTVPNPDGKLIAGLFAEGRIAGDSHDGFVVPATAIDQSSGTPTVLRVRDGKIERAIVQLGSVDLGTERVEITQGVAAGDQLVIGAARDVPVGAAVTITSSPTEG